ncbi:lipoate--protein ligase [Anaerovorax odorimutans]|uniref:lipoate--protein ligase n=1 Tax=Anaerovorax odorimutans TaxID=109327 RepID=A0ABT1RQY7_9FIRM|nr:lipoate--protein ligase [Anaerovorax odorimutans]MCQ4637611.1 lipoate--protein ligase [Anaerovorax odorimutans]
MIKRLWLLDTAETLPYKNLAVEEYLTMNVPEETCILFLWRNRHTVVIGRNQNLLKECDVERAEKDGIFMVRRLSGGGAVFHDLGNLNFTFIVRKEDYDISRQIGVILAALENLGITAEQTGRNDVTVCGAKISGNAFYRMSGRCYHHGTLLIDTDKNKIEKYLRVSKEKLALKGVDSVKSRVANLRDFKADITVSEVKEALEDAFGRVYGLPVNRLSEETLPSGTIDPLVQRYLSEEWNRGENRFYNRRLKQRFDWGDIEMLLQIKKGIVKEADIYSDAMDQDYISRMKTSLAGCESSKERLTAAIDRVAVSQNNLSDSMIERIRSDVKALIQNSDLQ